MISFYPLFVNCNGLSCFDSILVSCFSLIYHILYFILFCIYLFLSSFNPKKTYYQLLTVLFFAFLFQFRLAYVAPESRVVGAGDLVDEPKKIAVRYLRGYFLLDFIVVLPLPQVTCFILLS